MKSFQLCITFQILIFCSSTIWADIILLKSGKTLEGKFIETNPNYTILNNFDKNIRIPNSEIASMEVGYSGIPVCYSIKGQDENCNAKLHLLSQSKVVIVYGKGFLEVLEADPEDFESIKVKLTAKEKNISKYIRAGIGMQIDEGNGKSKKGKLISIADDGNLSIESEDDEVWIVSEDKIQNFTYYSPSWISFPKSKTYSKVVPGLVQIQNGEQWKGGSIMGLALISLIGSAVEFNNAQRASSPQVNYIPIGSQLIATSIFSNNNKFESHKNNFQILSIGFVIVYLYHHYDLYSSNKDESSNSEEMKPINYSKYFYSSYPERPGPYSLWNYGNSQYLEYSLRF